MAYCVVCYLVTALLFSLLILDLAALVITVAPSKAIFKYTDLVYTGEQPPLSTLKSGGRQGFEGGAEGLLLPANIFCRVAAAASQHPCQQTMRQFPPLRPSYIVKLGPIACLLACLPPPRMPTCCRPAVLPPPQNTENFKTSRLVFQAWLQSAPELVVIGLILYRNMTPAGPAVIVPGPLLLQVCAAHPAAGREFACCKGGAAPVSGWLGACLFCSWLGARLFLRLGLWSLSCVAASFL